MKAPESSAFAAKPKPSRVSSKTKAKLDSKGGKDRREETEDVKDRKHIICFKTNIF